MRIHRKYTGHSCELCDKEKISKNVHFQCSICFVSVVHLEGWHHIRIIYVISLFRNKRFVLKKCSNETLQNLLLIFYVFISYFRAFNFRK